MSKLNSKHFKDKMEKDKKASIPENLSGMLEPTSPSGEKPFLPTDQMAAGEAIGVNLADRAKELGSTGSMGQGLV